MKLFASGIGGSRFVWQAVPVAVMVLAYSLGTASAAIYAPDNFANGGGTNLETVVIVKDSTGRVLIGGAFTAVEGQAGHQGVARFNADGTLDAAFSIGANYYVKAIAVQGDGKILIGGKFNGVKPAGSATTTSIWGIARLNENGTLDNTFQNAPAGKVKSNLPVRGIAVQSGGKIVIVGHFTQIDGVARNHIARLNADGTLDTTFIVGAGANNDIEDVKLQADGKILIAGSFTSVQGIDIRGIARLNSDGSLDETFVPNAGVAGVINGSHGGLFPVYQIAIQTDGKIVANGGPLNFAGEVHRGVLRLNSNGTPDSTFKPFINDWGTSVALQTVGGEQKIVVGGSFTQAGERNVTSGAVIGTDVARQGIARFNSDGTVDASFDTSYSSNA